MNEPKPITATISAKTAALGMLFASEKDEMRPYLRGLHIRPCVGGGVNIMATDVHRLFISHQADGEADAPVTLRLTPLAVRACRSAARLNGFVRLQDNRLTVFSGIGATKEEIFIQPGPAIIGGTWPDVTKVLPKMADYRAGLHTDVQLKYLISLNALTDFKTEMVHLYSHKTDAMAPAVAVGSSADTCVLIMPVRDQRNPETLNNLFEKIKGPARVSPLVAQVAA